MWTASRSLYLIQGGSLPLNLINSTTTRPGTWTGNLSHPLHPLSLTLLNNPAHNLADPPSDVVDKTDLCPCTGLSSGQGEAVQRRGPAWPWESGRPPAVCPEERPTYHSLILICLHYCWRPQVSTLVPHILSSSTCNTERLFSNKTKIANFYRALPTHWTLFSAPDLYQLPSSLWQAPEEAPASILMFPRSHGSDRLSLGPGLRPSGPEAPVLTVAQSWNETRTSRYH